MEQMERDCDSIFVDDQKDFTFECFEIITQSCSREEVHVYRKAFRDCVHVLKSMGVLAQERTALPVPTPTFFHVLQTHYS